MIADGFFTATMRLGMNAKCGWQHAVALVRKDKQKSCEAWKQRAYANKRGNGDSHLYRGKGPFLHCIACFRLEPSKMQFVDDKLSSQHLPITDIPI